MAIYEIYYAEYDASGCRTMHRAGFLEAEDDDRIRDLIDAVPYGMSGVTGWHYSRVNLSTPEKLETKRDSMIELGVWHPANEKGK
jgi:hypothetical protein